MLRSAVDYCYMSSDVYFSCMHHALSTEVEEIMGLLIGWTDSIKRSCYITHTLLLQRLDKRKDRVEISPEVLASSITVCEKLNEEINTAKKRHRFPLVDGLTTGDSDWSADDPSKILHVVGWYHSHPHITVFPSEVDLRTQEQYQIGADPMWIGLIFGVYNNEEATKTNHFQYIAFQSVKNGNSFRLVQHLVPIIVDPHLSPIPNKSFDSIEAPLRRHCIIPDRKILENLHTSFRLLVEEETEAFLKARHELLFAGKEASSESTNQKNCGILKGFDSLHGSQLACVYSKNVSKIVGMLARPLNDVLGQIYDESKARNLTET